jgi:hypothetical protein
VAAGSPKLEHHGAYEMARGWHSAQGRPFR